MAAIHDRKAGFARRAASVLAWFARAQDGAVLVLGLILFVAMLMVSGIAVDVMRYESERVRFQGTADRAVLAATSLKNQNVTHTPAELAQEYFDAEGLGDYVQGNITVSETQDGGRRVDVAPQASLESLFMRWSGIDALEMSVPAAAVEGRGQDTKLEIVMVLDRSGSMGTTTSTGRTRLEELKIAAKQFVTSMTDEFDPEDIAISLVTYNNWVLPAPGMLNQMPNVTGNGPCMEFDDWHEMRLSITGQGTGLITNVIDTVGNLLDRALSVSGTRQSCSTDPMGEMQPLQNDPATLEDAIDALQAGGTTSVDLGARFGATLLDPSMRPVIDTMIDNGVVPDEMSGRPFDWNDDRVERALILMSDGENCCGARFNRTLQDRNTRAVCEGLRANDVMVYTVAFDAPQGAIDLMEDCASSANHFFNSDGDGLVAAFEGIATDVQAQALRLVR